MVRTPNQDKLKPSESVDAVINAYRVSLEDIEQEVKAGNMVILKGTLK